MWRFEPGYYELRGGAQTGKTTVALLLAMSKLWRGRTVFVTTQEEYSPSVTEAVTGEALPDWLVTVSRVSEFFELVSMVPWGQLVILDSLATLRPDHPAARQLAPSVERHWCRPPCPVLVVNQDRHPYPAGGWFWRLQLRGEFELVRYRDRPFLLSELRPGGMWLTWGSGRPELRMLLEEERHEWIGAVEVGGASTSGSFDLV